MADGTGARVGSDLFIIDNTDSEWDVLRYLSGWCRLSQGLDVASAYFEIGSLLALDGEWQKVDSIRILMGDEVTKKTKAVLAQALTARLDSSIEEQKVRDDFLDGVPAIVDAIKAGRIQFRVYRKTKFHAKAYITHAREEVIGSFALVGSSRTRREPSAPWSLSEWPRCDDCASGARRRARSDCIGRSGRAAVYALKAMATHSGASPFFSVKSLLWGRARA